MARPRPSTKQKKTAKIFLENAVKKGKTLQKKDIVALGGYGRSVQQTPAKVLESVGFKEALAELGLTESLIAKSLVSDIKSKPKRRVRELNLGAEILGMKKQGPTPQGQQNNIIIFTDGRAERIARRILTRGESGEASFG